MPAKRLSMRKIKDVLRLCWGQGLSGKPYRVASWGTVSSPRTTAKATFALNSLEYCCRFLLIDYTHSSLQY